MSLNKKVGRGQPSCFSRNARKRGMGKSLMIAMITGIMVLVIGFSWIFGESFSEDSIDWEACRQSLIARSVMPEADLAVAVFSSKEILPLKCGTKVVNIDYEDLERAEKEIAETVSSCWYMIGRGDYKIFPSMSSLTRESATPCMVCARIHIGSDVKEYYSEEETMINIERGINGQLEGYDTTIWDYLNPARGVSAFLYFKGWEEEGFNISRIYDVSRILDVAVDTEVFSFPKYLDPDRGDLFIAYAEPVRDGSEPDERAVDPYMVLVQDDNFGKLSSIWATSFSEEKFVERKDRNVLYKNEMIVCSSIETAPS